LADYDCDGTLVERVVVDSEVGIKKMFDKDDSGPVKKKDECKEDNVMFDMCDSKVFPRESLVKCVKCGKKIEEESEDYFSVFGNICVGKYRGIAGNNFDDGGRLKNVSIFCLDCFLEEIRRVMKNIRAGAEKDDNEMTY
jgi:hypothetical protein